MEGAAVGEILALAMFGVTILAVLIGYPAAFTLAGTGLFFAVLGYLLGVFNFSLFTGLASRYFGVMVNEVLVAVPLFIFMGVMLERSKIAVQLLETMGQLFGSWRGGLGISVVIVGALLAASTGIVGATVVTMGLLSLPAMLRAGYDPRLSCGIICASGTLGQIIPPSTVLIFMGDMLQGANAAAQAAKGNFVPDPVSVGDLFAGAFLPGLLLVALYIAWVAIRAFFWPAAAPAMVMTPDQRRNLPRQVIRALLPALLLIVAVLGSIIGGIASPTESASVGAVGAMLLSMLNRQFSLRILLEVMRSTMKISSMVFLILLGASVFSLVFRGLGGERIVHDVLSALPGGVDGAVLIVMLLTFFLGFFLDTFEIIFIVVPITAPVLLGLDVDPIWLGVMFGINLQTSFLTPPFGFSLFYLRGVAPATITTGNMYLGVAPFVLLQLIAMLILWEFPGLATWLPAAVYGDAVAYEGVDPSLLEMPEGELMLPGDEPDLADPDSEAGTLEDMLSGEDPVAPAAE
ncbi:MAG: TRAP transporter large permease subunit [Dongiaceae bacterium]